MAIVPHERRRSKLPSRNRVAMLVGAIASTVLVVPVILAVLCPWIATAVQVEFSAISAILGFAGLGLAWVAYTKAESRPPEKYQEDIGTNR